MTNAHDGTINQGIDAFRRVTQLNFDQRSDPTIVGGVFMCEAITFIGHAVAPLDSMHVAIMPRARCNRFFTASTLAPTSAAIRAIGASRR